MEDITYKDIERRLKELENKVNREPSGVDIDESDRIIDIVVKVLIKAKHNHIDDNINALPYDVDMLWTDIVVGLGSKFGARVMEKLSNG